MLPYSSLSAGWRASLTLDGNEFVYTSIIRARRSGSSMVSARPHHGGGCNEELDWRCSPKKNGMWRFCPLARSSALPVANGREGCFRIVIGEREPKHTPSWSRSGCAGYIADRQPTGDHRYPLNLRGKAL